MTAAATTERKALRLTKGGRYRVKAERAFLDAPRVTTHHYGISWTHETRRLPPGDVLVYVDTRPGMGSDPVHEAWFRREADGFTGAFSPACWGMVYESDLAPVRKMTLDEFRATRREVPDIGAVLADQMLEGVPGLVYLDSLYIEKRTDRWSAQAAAHGAYNLILCNDEWISDDLPLLEAKLYEFAEGEGYLDVEAAP